MAVLVRLLLVGNPRALAPGLVRHICGLGVTRRGDVTGTYQQLSGVGGIPAL